MRNDVLTRHASVGPGGFRGFFLHRKKTIESQLRSRSSALRRPQKNITQEKSVTGRAKNGRRSWEGKGEAGKVKAVSVEEGGIVAAPCTRTGLADV